MFSNNIQVQISFKAKMKTQVLQSEHEDYNRQHLCFTVAHVRQSAWKDCCLCFPCKPNESHNDHLAASPRAHLSACSFVSFSVYPLFEPPWESYKVNSVRGNAKSANTMITSVIALGGPAKINTKLKTRVKQSRLPRMRGCVCLRNVPQRSLHCCPCS